MNSFRQLAFLRGAHGFILRILGYAAAFVLVLVVSGRPSLAHHAGGFWARDEFLQGAHVLRWHLSQGWTGRFLRQTPEFDASAVMDTRRRAIVKAQLFKRVRCNRNASWGHSLQRDRFALLSFLARDYHETGDLVPYQEIADLIVGDLCTASAVAKPVSKSTQFTRADARDALVSVARMLDGISTPWYLVSGTFLGAVREGDFLSHDYDVDIGINIEDLDVDRLRAAALADPDLTLVNEDPYIHQVALRCLDVRPCLFRMMHRSGIEIDVFVHHLDAGQRWHGSTTHCWTNQDFTFAQYDIAGIAVRGPANADVYLTENYGNWRVPVTVFNCSTGTPNVSFNHNLFSVSRLLHRAAQATQDHSDTTAEISRLILVQEGYLTEGKTRWDWQVPWAS